MRNFICLLGVMFIVVFIMPAHADENKSGIKIIQKEVVGKWKFSEYRSKDLTHFCKLQIYKADEGGNGSPIWAFTISNGLISFYSAAPFQESMNIVNSRPQLIVTKSDGLRIFSGGHSHFYRARLYSPEGIRDPSYGHTVIYNGVKMSVAEIKQLLIGLDNAKKIEVLHTSMFSSGVKTIALPMTGFNKLYPKLVSCEINSQKNNR